MEKGRFMKDTEQDHHRGNRRRLWRLSRIDVPLTSAKVMTMSYYYRFHRSSRHSTAALQEEGYHVKCPRALFANGLVRILTIA